jgi:NTP pyrophosphatase (non-canonical NTP hydrolase)
MAVKLYNSHMIKKPTVTLIGSYRKDHKALVSIFTVLSSNYNLLCPKSIDFVDATAAFVRSADESDESAHAIEEGVLDSVRNSDFVWLFAPNGYVGTSAAFEMGVAHVLGVPIYTDIVLTDEMLASMVTDVIKSPKEVVISVHHPGGGISGLQQYYARIAERRGWASESPKDTMLLLTEEIGELARAIRKTEGLKRAAGYDNVDVAEELADVQLYLVHLATALGIKLDEAVNNKEMKNYERAG